MNAKAHIKKIDEINAAEDEYQLSLLVLNYALELRKPTEVIDAALRESNLAFFRLSQIKDEKASEL